MGSVASGRRRDQLTVAVLCRVSRNVSQLARRMSRDVPPSGLDRERRFFASSEFRADPVGNVTAATGLASPRLDLI
jgi:hypothetical protein